jgi:hypothetical protein
MDFSELAERGFWQDPTDGAFTEEAWNGIHEKWLKAVKENDEIMWELSVKLKIIGKHFPLNDNRNPDNPIYCRQQG